MLYFLKLTKFLVDRELNQHFRWSADWVTLLYCLLKFHMWGHFFKPEVLKTTWKPEKDDFHSKFSGQRTHGMPITINILHITGILLCFVLCPYSTHLKLLCISVLVLFFFSCYFSDRTSLTTYCDVIVSILLVLPSSISLVSSLLMRI